MLVASAAAATPRTPSGGRRLVAQGLRVECVATSRTTEALARSVGLTVRLFDDIARLDLTIDG
jgi:ribose 5-phosphate isomerase A